VNTCPKVRISPQTRSCPLKTNGKSVKERMQKGRANTHTAHNHTLINGKGNKSRSPPATKPLRQAAKYSQRRVVNTSVTASASPKKQVEPCDTQPPRVVTFVVISTVALKVKFHGDTRKYLAVFLANERKHSTPDLLLRQASAGRL